MLEFYFALEFIHFIMLSLSIVGGVIWFGCGGLSCILFIHRATYIGGATHWHKEDIFKDGLQEVNYQIREW